MAAIPLTDDQRGKLVDLVDGIMDFDEDPDVKDIFNGSENWDWVKNATEVMCFSQALEGLTEIGAFGEVDRVHKISGRYTLGDAFDLDVFEQNPDKIIVKHAMNSQFPHTATLVDKQYMSRLWSWPASMTDDIIEVYQRGFSYIAERISQGGYCDIEHMLYKFLPKNHILEVARTGVSGNIGPNGMRIDD